MSGLSKRQLALRRDGIGASEIAALTGLSRWATPIEIFEAKLNPDHEKDVTLAMRLGNEFEEPIARVYAADTKLWVKPVDTLKHPTKPIAFATPDRAAWGSKQPQFSARKKLTREEIQTCEKLVQIKSTSWRLKSEWGEAGTDQIAQHYLIQGQWEMGVSGVALLDFAVLFDKDDFKIYPLRFDAEMFEMLYEVGARFMRDHVATGRPPPIDYTEKYSEYLARKYPGRFYGKKEPLDLVEATPAQVADVLLYSKLKEAGARLKNHLGLVTNRLKEVIGEHAGIHHEDFGRLTWKRTRDSTAIDWKAIAIESRTIAGMLVNPNGEVKLDDAARLELATRLSKLEAVYTTPKPGYRRFNSKWENKAIIELEELTLSLSRLEGGTNAVDADESDEAPW